ncbi:hypothetical protein ACLOJK_029266 [Asimina triloba]
MVGVGEELLFRDGEDGVRRCWPSDLDPMDEGDSCWIGQVAWLGQSCWPGCRGCEGAERLLWAASDLMKEVGHVAMNGAGGLLAADGRTVGAIWGRCPSMSRRRWAASDGGVGRSKETQMGWIGEDDGAPYWCSVLRRSIENVVCMALQALARSMTTVVENFSFDPAESGAKD